MKNKEQKCEHYPKFSDLGYWFCAICGKIPMDNASLKPPIPHPEAPASWEEEFELKWKRGLFNLPSTKDIKDFIEHLLLSQAKKYVEEIEKGKRQIANPGDEALQDICMDIGYNSGLSDAIKIIMKNI